MAQENQGTPKNMYKEKKYSERRRKPDIKCGYSIEILNSSS